jgi:hypothetical protein
MTDDKIFAFVLMPFDAQFNDIYKLGIKELAATLGITAERVDEQIYREGILERIYRQIEKADIIIADMTGKNANVFYEVGYAHAKDKICVLLTSKVEDIPFDLRHKRHIIYGGSILTLKEHLAEELAWAKKEIENVKKTHIKVSLKSVNGSLSSDKHEATADLEFKIDLHNETAKASPDIEAAYIYAGSNAWTFRIDDKICPYTDSDIQSFKYKYFMQLPVRKLQKRQWAQLVFTGTKVLASVFKGDELKSSYLIRGKMLLRLVTSDGDFDYELPIDATIDEFPF